MNRSLILACLATATLVLPGCINVSRTSVRDEPRASVTFASDKAASVFYEAFSQRPDAGRREEQRTSVSLILINSSQKVIEGPNVAFNAAVQIADANHDGTITEVEAAGYAAYIGVKPAGERPGLTKL